MWCVFTEKWQLKRIGASSILRPFGGRLVLLHVRDCKGECFWRTQSVRILWENLLRSVTRKIESGGGLRETSLYVVSKLGS